jgi:tetratricopeptide (TPR) repeat protein
MILILLLMVSLIPPIAVGDELPEVNSPAYFQTYDDSLGYSGFRALSGEEQLKRRETARMWLGHSKDAVAASRGIGTSRSFRTVTANEQRGALVNALNAAATAAGYCPYMAEAWLQYAQVANYLGQSRAALACLAHAEKTIPYERSEDRQEKNWVERHRIGAVAAYNLDRYEEALESALYVMERDDGSWETKLLAARTLVHLGEYHRARMLISSFPEDSPNHATALGVLGVAELESGNHAAAELAFERAYEKGLRDPTFENDRGRLYLEMGDYGRAIRYFERAVEATPQFFEAKSNIAVAQRRGGDLEASIQTLNALIEESPGYAPAYTNLAEVYRELAQSSEGDERAEWARRAWREYNLALEFGADADQILTRRATLSVFVDDLESAEEDLLSLSGDPTVSARVLTVLGRVKKEQGRLDIAEQILVMATAREDADGLAWAELGEIRLRRQDAQGARDALEQACLLDAKLIVSRVNLSIACSALGDHEAAQAAIDQAERLDPDHPLVKQQKRNLRLGNQP